MKINLKQFKRYLSIFMSTWIFMDNEFISALLLYIHTSRYFKRTIKVPRTRKVFPNSAHSSDLIRGGVRSSLAWGKGSRAATQLWLWARFACVHRYFQVPILLIWSIILNPLLHIKNVQYSLLPYLLRRFKQKTKIVYCF